MLGRTGLHAIKALAVLAGAEGGAYMGAAAIAARIRAPGNYLGKLLQTLARTGLVEGRKGLQGGFRLGRRADQISLYDVAEPIERISRWRGCFLSHGDCRTDHPCPAHDRWAGVRETYVKFLQETTIEDVATGIDDIAHSSSLPAKPPSLKRSGSRTRQRKRS
jgi:Rrf2 family iron-sulfur cluster assembly transcriptional regulator